MHNRNSLIVIQNVEEASEARAVKLLNKLLRQGVVQLLPPYLKGEPTHYRLMRHFFNTCNYLEMSARTMYGTTIEYRLVYRVVGSYFWMCYGRGHCDHAMIP